MGTNLFNDLFVLEAANNHLGSIERGLRIVTEYGHVVRYHGVKATIKLQLRDPNTFVHKDFREREDIRYIKKCMQCRMPREHFKSLAEAIRSYGCIVSATAFDEPSVDLAEEIGCKILKIASSDVTDWGLLEKIASKRIPVIASLGGTSLEDMDKIVDFFGKRGIPLGINHCVAIYPTEDEELDLNQIDFLRQRYPGMTIGLSTHEHGDWHTSMAISYAKGARMWERHVEVDHDGIKVSPYCSLPHQIDEWFRTYAKVKAMCGAPGTEKRIPPRKEIEYLNSLVRGAYAYRAIPAGHVIQRGDLYLAVPLQKGQLSCREFILGERLTKWLDKDAPLTVDHIDLDPSLKNLIADRGL
jgi:N-acetylneuraminate synthase